MHFYINLYFVLGLREDLGPCGMTTKLTPKGVLTLPAEGIGFSLSLFREARISKGIQIVLTAYMAFRSESADLY